MIVLGIETSCDETAAAIVKDGKEVLSNIVYTQLDVHKTWGGVVPELASREHLIFINDVINEAISKAQIDITDIDLVAVTQGPGLLGSLLVGINTAKTFSWLHGKNLITVNHLHGHICANFLESVSMEKIEPPFLCLLVSGGHTQIIKVDDYVNYQVLGESIDDACGEAFDKVAKLLDIDFPGGPNLDKLAQSATDTFVSDQSIEAKSILHGRYSFPIAQVQGDYDFSFSGLKTSVLRLKEAMSDELWQKDKAKIARAFQETVTKTLLRKVKKALNDFDYNKIVIAGGVAANSSIRENFKVEFSKENGYQLSIPGLQFCTDNAAMIAAAGYYKKQSGTALADFGFEAFSR